VNVKITFAESKINFSKNLPGQDFNLILFTFLTLIMMIIAADDAPTILAKTSLNQHVQL
jgi:hypothetical protein